MEAGAAVGRVAEVVHFVARFPQAGDDGGEVLVPPTGCDVDSGHGFDVRFDEDNHFCRNRRNFLYCSITTEYDGQTRT